jgi:hypothetical protein
LPEIGFQQPSANFVCFQLLPFQAVAVNPVGASGIGLELGGLAEETLGIPHDACIKDETPIPCRLADRSLSVGGHDNSTGNEADVDE